MAGLLTEKKCLDILSVNKEANLTASKTLGAEEGKDEYFCSSS